MAESRQDLLLHPVRLQIIMALIDRQLTPFQLSEVLPDVPLTSLYRHLNKLVAGGVLQIVAERPVRGTLEKVYGLNPAQAHLGPTEIAGTTREEWLRYFTNFMVWQIADFSRYLNRVTDPPDLLADGVSFSQAPLYLSDVEVAEFGAKMRDAILPYLANRPDPNRRRRLLTTIFMPGADEPTPPDQS